jgi:hypothetical protein
MYEELARRAPACESGERENSPRYECGLPPGPKVSPSAYDRRGESGSVRDPIFKDQLQGRDYQSRIGV